MHMLSRPWRHRLLALHVAAGAGALGAGLVLLTLHGGSPAGTVPAIGLAAAHVVLLVVILGLLVLRRGWHRRSGNPPEAGSEPRP